MKHSAQRRLSNGNSRLHSLTGAIAVSIALLCFLVVPAHSQTLTTLHSFAGGATGDGAVPYWRVFRDSSGNLYGTTYYGGNLVDTNGAGTVFKLDPSGTETILHIFAGGTDGKNPYGGVLRDAAGNLYGTTVYGGDPTCNCGIVFKINAVGTYSILHKFIGGKDGSHPYATVIRDSAGTLYGTTHDGGASGLGTIYKITSAGKESIFHSFTTSDGTNPYFNLFRDSAGNFYGTTSAGGAHQAGTVFTFNSAGKRTRVFSFQPWNGAPNSPVVRDSAGNLYGVTGGGGQLAYGTLYKIDTSGKRTQVFSFGTTEGVGPGGALLQDTAGNLYGTTSTGYGAFGTVWKYDPSAATVSNLYAFSYLSPENGQGPTGGVVMDSLGNFYGTTTWGGDLACVNPTIDFATGCGTVFMLTP